MATSLTDTEREKIRDSEVLRRDIQQTLQDESSGSKFSAFFKHPAVLLVLGFALTSLLGSYLTSHWSRADWKAQQHHLEEQHTLDARYSVIERTFKETSETNTAAEDILASYTWGNWTLNEIEERKKYWQTTSRNWRVGSKILQQDLNIYFTNPKISSTFQEIVDTRRQLGNSITNLLRGGTKKSEVKAELETDQALINATEDLMKVCGALMIEETRKELASTEQ